MKIKAVVGPIAILAIIIGSIVVLSKEDTNVAVETDTPASNATTTPTPTPKKSGFTMADVSINNTKSSCYTVINNKVYNLTDWIEEHPGGSSNILRICGIDGTSAFERQHGGSKGAENQLASFLIGDLVVE